jgi:cell division transport system permease protein
LKIGMVSLCPARFDELGLRRALADRLVPLLVAVMAFLAALSTAGWMGSAVLIGRWENGGGSALTVQVPASTEPVTTNASARLSAAREVLVSTPGIQSIKILSREDLTNLLQPWLITNITDIPVPIPTVIVVHINRGQGNLRALSSRLAEKVPGAILEDHNAWAGNLAALAHVLQLCAGFMLFIVTLVTVAVIVVATRSGLASRRDAILIIYQLGATDRYIAHRFSCHAATLASIGGLVGGSLALPVVLGLAALASPLAGRDSPFLTATAVFGFLPMPLWLLPLLMVQSTAFVGYLTAQITMWQWLRRLNGGGTE